MELLTDQHRASFPVKGALAEAVQGSGEVTILGDSQKGSGQGPGQL